MPINQRFRCDNGNAVRGTGPIKFNQACRVTDVSVHGRDKLNKVRLTVKTIAQMRITSAELHYPTKDLLYLIKAALVAQFYDNFHARVTFFRKQKATTAIDETGEPLVKATVPLCLA